jgi:hypothetical protein
MKIVEWWFALGVFPGIIRIYQIRKRNEHPKNAGPADAVLAVFVCATNCWPGSLVCGV